jgi:hypothetical protein
MVANAAKASSEAGGGSSGGDALVAGTLYPATVEISRT